MTDTTPAEGTEHPGCTECGGTGTVYLPDVDGWHPEPCDAYAPAEGTEGRLPAPDGVKMTRETLCAAQSAILASRFDVGRQPEHVERLQRLIDACDAHRPLGPNGKHGDRHTATCGCTDRPTPPVPAAEDDAVDPWRVAHERDTAIWADAHRDLMAERDEARQQVADLRVGIEALLTNAHDADTWVDPKHLAALAEPGGQVGETFRVEVRGRGYGKTQAMAERVADAVERRGLPAEVLPVPAPVVPDSAGVRERVREVVDARIEAHWPDAPNGCDANDRECDAYEDCVADVTDAVLAVVGQGVTSAEDGAALIAAERRRHIEDEGWTPEHDAAHDPEDLARAAVCYATEPGKRMEHTGLPPYRIGWPWESVAWKPVPDDRVRELVKAGSLIAAAIDAHRAVVRPGEPAPSTTTEGA